MKTILIRNTAEKDIHITVEVARSALQKLKGLMFRRHLPERHGILFIFKDNSRPAFWTLFTWIPLEAVFIERKGRIAEIVPMPPHRRGPFRSAHESRYVLELNRHFCKRHRIKKGCKVNLKSIL